MNEQLLKAWDSLNNAIKNVETANIRNLSGRVDWMMERRAVFDDLLMKAALASAKSA